MRPILLIAAIAIVAGLAGCAAHPSDNAWKNCVAYFVTNLEQDYPDVDPIDRNAIAAEACDKQSKEDAQHFEELWAD